PDHRARPRLLASVAARGRGRPCDGLPDDPAMMALLPGNRPDAILLDVVGPPDPLDVLHLQHSSPPLTPHPFIDEGSGAMPPVGPNYSAVPCPSGAVLCRRIQLDGDGRDVGNRHGNHVSRATAPIMTAPMNALSQN